MSDGASAASIPVAIATPAESALALRHAFAHDLRAAITPLGLWVNLALDPGITDEQRIERIHKIESIVKRLEASVQRFTALLPIPSPLDGPASSPPPAAGDAARPEPPPPV